MGWQENEARDNVLRALMVYEELCGESALITLLDHELSRKLVFRRMRTVQRIAATERERDLERRLNIALDTLDFYADGDNWEKQQGRRLSAMEKDKGKRAADCLASIGDDTDGK